MMHYRPLRSALRFTALPALLVLASACGSSGGSDQDAAAITAAESAQIAVSASPQPDGATAKGLSKLEPVVRPGAEAPLDSTPDRISKHAGKALFATGFEGGVELTRLGTSPYQDLVGGDRDGFSFPITLGSVLAESPSRILTEISRNLPYPASAYAASELKRVAGRDGGTTRALSLNSKHNTWHDQQISMGSSGLSGAPAIFQRMWVKFDENTLHRARQVGAAHFYQTFWEVKGEGEQWLRLKLHYDDAKGLVWVAKGSGVTGTPSWWTDRLDTVPVVVASPAIADGWHQVEIWLDPKEGRFKVAIDGQTLVDRAGVLMGSGAGWIRNFRMMMVASTVAPVAEVLFDDLEIWDLPPGNAFAKVN